ncbi:hypothetical protein BH23PLA1_BH23PLA1_24900 [soil metagenome]
MKLSLKSAIGAFGADAKAKLSNPAVSGEPEDQLRAPLERLFSDLAELCSLPRSAVASVGESSLAHLKTRPDYAITVRDTLVGFVEVKSPGKGADPRRYKDKHDKQQWEKLQSLPNLLYTDGNAFSLWRSGELAGEIVRLNGDVETSGSGLDAPLSLLNLFENFLHWEPIPPRDAKQLAETTARLCRLLRDEVTEQLAIGNQALANLATDWQKIFNPDATDAQFADGYAQAVTFGLLMARARDIRLGAGLDRVARELGQTNSLIGSALYFLTFNIETHTLKTSLETLTRVLDAVQWETISKGDPESWLYFYEDFLAVYDNNLRKQTGSYYTPPEVVAAMVRMVDDVLRLTFQLPDGLASQAVTVADPAVGTGTYLLGILRHIAEQIEADQGPGAVPAAIKAAVGRLIGFELQLGPFAVAQMRILAELADLIGTTPKTTPRLFVADTLGSPEDEEGWIPSLYGPVAESRRQANEIKRTEPITVVIGNPPYKEKAKGRGGWIEDAGDDPSPLMDWMPPPGWGAGAHAKHLRNLYVYFWRWATWKVFDQDPKADTGVVCFITVAGFLNGPGFQKMRDDLRRKADRIWVIDCSPEGHQPDVPTRIFQGVQQPVCIVIASRPPGTDSTVPARVRFCSLPAGLREEKFEALSRLALASDDWAECPTEWRAPFLPAMSGAWATYPALSDLFIYNGSGVKAGRVWVIAPDQESLVRRWQRLIEATHDQKEALFHPHYLNGQPGDRHPAKVVRTGLMNYPTNLKPVADERGSCLPPMRYGYRSFDRQWIIPDNRLIDRPNPNLWERHSDHQVYLTALSRYSPTAGPALTYTGLIPDGDHYKGSFSGRVFPLWSDRGATQPNVPPGLLAYLGQRYEAEIGAEDLMAYIAAIAAHPAYIARFRSDLTQPGLRIPLTADGDTFAEAAELGKTIIWMHTFGERFADPARDRPASPPRLPKGQGPRIPADGAIPQDPAAMPDTIEYDAATQRLLIGSGCVENVPPEVWRYEVSGKQVLRQWFSYRKKNRERPIIGDRRQPSKLGDIQPDHWPAEYTSELLNVLHVLGRLVALEPTQADLLERVCSGPTITAEELRTAGALADPAGSSRGTGGGSLDQPTLFD